MTNILKFLYPKRSTKRKILDIVDDIKHLIQPLSKEKIWIYWYGAYEIDPKNLVIWICTQSDLTKSKLEANVDLINEIRDILIKNGYQKPAIPSVYIGFESQETVDRESRGNWYVHFK